VCRHRDGTVRAINGVHLNLIVGETVSNMARTGFWTALATIPTSGRRWAHMRRSRKTSDALQADPD
jgi:hypothetical protein